MLKLQYQDTSRSVWLIGPIMRVGADKTNDLIVQEEGVADTHCRIHISELNLEIETFHDNKVFINENPVSGKKPLSLGDVIRIGAQEFKIVEPKDTTSRKPASDLSGQSTAALNSTIISPVPVKEVSGWMLQGVHKNLSKRYPIDGTIVLGRSKECGLNFSYDRLSRKHAELKVINDVLIIKDLDSSNGTFHNGEKIKQANLRSGDTVAFDKLEFIVIGPEEKSSANEPHNFKQTAVRPVITSEMVKQAKKPTENNANNSNMDIKTAAVINKQPGDHWNKSGIIMVAAALVILGVVTIVLFV